MNQHFRAARIPTHTAAALLFSALAGAGLSLPCFGEDVLEARVVPEAPNRLRAGEWGTLAVLVSNYEDQAANVEVIVNFESDKSREFTRSVWVPPKSQRRGWLPVQAPQDKPDGPWRIRSRFHRLDKDGNKVIQRLGTNKALFEETLMSASNARYPTLVYLNERDPDLDAIYEAIQKTRESISLSPILLSSAGARPASPRWLDSISLLVIAEDIHDAAALSSIRRWVRSGGRVWMMMDRVSMETVVAIAGDDAAAGVVGRETVSELSFERLEPFPESVPQVDFDEPVDFCFLIEPPGTVMCTANGWPAATTLGVNNGQVLLTTVEVAAWPVATRRWLASLIYEGDRGELPWPETAINTALLDQIGQQVPSRMLVMGVLGALTLSLAVGGLWLLRRGVLEQLVWLVPVLSMVAASGLVALGMSARRDAPSTLATIQVAQAASGTGHVNIRSTTLFYSTEGSREPLSGQATIAQGAAPPSRTRNAGDGSWTWEGQLPPPGTRLYQVNDEAAAAVRAIARFTENGLEGELQGLASADVEDAVVASHGMPSLAVRWQGKRFTAGIDNTLGSNQHIPSQMVNDTGRRRQQILRELWSGNGAAWRADSPSLACWTEPWPDTVNWPATDRQIGDALTVVPLELQPSPSGSRVQVPGSLMTLRTRSSLFNTPKARWVGQFNGPSTFRVSFELPACLENASFDSAVLNFKITAPGRTVTIKDHTGRLLNEFSSPTGVTTTKITEANSLDVDNQMIHLDFEVSDAEGRAADSKWSIDYMLLHAEGTVN